MRILLKSINGKVRENDEDSILGISFQNVTSGIPRERAILALADGMGGGSAGEIASKMLISCATEKLAPMLAEEAINPKDIEGAIQASFVEANKKITDYAVKNGLDMMGTTGLIAFIDGNDVVIGNVGDSRAYIISKSSIRQITHDHSFVQTLFDQGLITKDEMRSHPQKNLLTLAVGMEKNIRSDITKIKLFRDDYLLLCCDGLWESMPEFDIMTTLRSDEPDKAFESLIDLANALDGSDNVSAVLYIPPKSCQSMEEYTGLATKKLENVKEG